jgi:hypothetical protein
MNYLLLANIIDLIAIPTWIIIWWVVGGFKRAKSNKMMLIPFALALIYLIGNATISLNFSEIGDVAYEESRFAFIDRRTDVGLGAATGALVVATIVYGLTIKTLPIIFLKFIISAYIALIGLSAPILWIPIEVPEMFFLLRHFQTVAMNSGLFLIVGAVIILLDDLMKYGKEHIVSKSL